MRNRYPFAVALTSALAMAACGQTPDPVATPAAPGSARIALISVDQVPAIDHVTLTITGAASSVKELMTRVDETHYAATVGSIPAGTYTFTADAWAEPADATLVATGTATGVVITSGASTSVLITMFEVNPAPGPTRKTPQLDALTASPSSVVVGGVAGVSVSAHSPEDHALTYLWSDICDGGVHGTFADATAASTTWTAPASSVSCLLSVTVSDETNITTVTGFLPIFVAELQMGTAVVTALLDTFPIVVVGTVDAFIVTSEPAPPDLSVGITANAIASASDPDGDAVTFKWTSNAGCPGTFTPDDTTASITFHTGDPRALCTLALTVTDSRGKSVTATVVLTENLCAGVTCPPATDLCHVAGTCNPLTGTCGPETPVSCPGDQACDPANGQCARRRPCAGGTCPPVTDPYHTAGSCVPAGTCGPENSIACPRGQACEPTTACPPADRRCHVAGTCNPATGACSAETAVVCPTGTVSSRFDGKCHLASHVYGAIGSAGR